jgi:xanthine dehydrogenase accessory factor
MEDCSIPAAPQRSLYQELLRALAAPAAPDGPAAIATVVHVDGSAYRREGAQMLVWRDGRRLGLLSGGCLEDDVALHAPKVFDGGAPLLLGYDLRADGDDLWGLGIGCNGAVEVFVEGLDPEHPLRQSARWLLDGRSVSSALVLDGPDAGRRLLRSADGRTAGSLPDAVLAAVPDPEGPALAEDAALAGRRVYRERRRPPAVLAVFGATDDVVPVVHLAAEAGLRVFVVDHRQGLAAAARFPEAEGFWHVREEDLDAGLAAARFDAAVVMTHNLARDAAILRHLAGRDLAYAGLLGPWARAERVLRRAGAAPASLHAPVGLDLGAESPEEIALSIVAEVVAALRGRPAGFLSGRRGALHERADAALTGN